MLTRLLALGVLCACAPEEAPLPGNPDRASVRIEATLEDACRLDGDGRIDASRMAWHRAHALFQSEVEPHLRQDRDPREVARIEYAFGRVLSELSADRGRPDRAVDDLVERLHTALAEPEPEPVSEGSGA